MKYLIIVWRFFWWVVWELSEGSGFDLGYVAPWVLSQMTGSKRKKDSSHA